MEVLMVKSDINAGFSMPWLPLFIYPESSSNQSDDSPDLEVSWQQRRPYFGSNSVFNKAPKPFYC
jgi:hypothetical protein